MAFATSRHSSSSSTQEHPTTERGLRIEKTPKFFDYLSRAEWRRKNTKKTGIQTPDRREQCSDPDLDSLEARERPGAILPSPEPDAEEKTLAAPTQDPQTVRRRTTGKDSAGEHHQEPPPDHSNDQNVIHEQEHHQHHHLHTLHVSLITCQRVEATDGQPNSVINEDTAAEYAGTSLVLGAPHHTIISRDIHHRLVQEADFIDVTSMVFYPQGAWHPWHPQNPRFWR